MVLAVFACVFAVIGVIDAVANWGRIYQGVSIGEVDVSGMTVPEARAAVQEAYGARVGGARVSIFADEESRERARAGEALDEEPSSEDLSVEEAARRRKLWRTDAAALQARLSTEDLADEALAVGREDGGVLGRLAAQTFGYEIAPRVQMSDSAVESLASDIDRAIGSPHADFDISVDYGEAVVVEGHDGWEVDRDRLREELSRQFLSDAEDRSFIAEAEFAGARIGRDAAQQVADEVNRGIGAGAEFVFNGIAWNASAYDLGTLVTTDIIERDGEGWVLVPSYDESLAKNDILMHLQSSYGDQDIRVEFVESGGSVMVRTNASGTMPEVGDAVANLERATLREEPEGTPVIQVNGTQIPSAMSVQAAMDYGIVTTIAEYETEYTGGATARNNNIHLAADLLDDSIVKADGGTWSFNDTAGECNEEKGFQGAGSIVNGETVDEIGGGICQVATTVFNAVFESGYPIDERKNHSLYIASYPAGRDAAISWPYLDLRWHNDSANDILMQTGWTDTTVTVKLIGVDPSYTVRAETGEFEKGAEYGTRTEIDPSLPEGTSQVRQSGQDGSTISVRRTVTDGKGQIVRQDEFVSVYDAKDEIIVTGGGSAGA